MNKYSCRIGPGPGFGRQLKSNFLLSWVRFNSKSTVELIEVLLIYDIIEILKQPNLIIFLSGSPSCVIRHIYNSQRSCVQM